MRHEERKKCGGEVVQEQRAPNAIERCVLEQQPDRRRFLTTGGALAVGGAAAYSIPGVAMAGGGAEVSPDHQKENFTGIDTSAFGPLTADNPIEITALDFTRGLSGTIDSIGSLDAGVKQALLNKIADVDAAVGANNDVDAQDRLGELEDLVTANAAAIDLAAGVFVFDEVTSFSQSIIQQVSWLRSLGSQVVGVIYVFDTDQLIKIVQTFTVLDTWFITTIVQQWTVYAHYWLFILVMRFKVFPGLKISIDMYLLYICVCLQLTITTQVVVCMREVQSQIELIEC